MENSTLDTQIHATMCEATTLGPYAVLCRRYGLTVPRAGYKSYAAGSIQG